MKLRFMSGLLAMLAASFAFASAAPQPLPLPAKRTIAFQHNIEQASLTGNFEIILIPGYSDRIVMSGEEETIRQVKTSFKNGKLSVYDHRSDRSNPIRIYLAAKKLTRLSANGTGRISTESPLQTALLQVFLNGDINVSLNSSGKVNVLTGNDYELIAQ